MNSKEWKDVKLKDITILISRGITPKYTDSEGVIVINQKCIRNGQINLKESRLTDDKTKKISENKFVDNNDILICSTGIGTLGRVGFLRNKLNTKLTVDSHVSIVRANKDYTNPIFLGYNLFLRQSEIEAMAKGSTGQTELSRIDLGEMNISLPPLEIQEKIASILSSLDDKIELNNKINQNLEQQAQAIFKSWFVDFEPFGGKMPDDWKVGNLYEIANVTMGQSPDGKSYNENGYGEVFYQGRAEFGSRYPTRRLYTTEPKRMANAGDILMSVRAPVGDINVALEKCCIGRGLASISSRDNFNSFILYTLMNLKRSFDIYNAEGTVFGAINKDSLNSIEVIIPTKEEIYKFEEIVSNLDKMIRQNTIEVQKLQKIRDTLLPKLMSGEIDVDKVEV